MIFALNCCDRYVHKLELIKFIDNISFFFTYITITDPVFQVEDATFGCVPVRIYRPKNAGDHPLPGVVYFHGGGWCWEVWGEDCNHAYWMKTCFDFKVF